MGYCNKRKRSKRRRTRSLNAMKSHHDVHRNVSSSDNSSIEFLDQSSSFTSICSTYSHHSYTNFEVPTSIFLDDLNNHEIQVDGGEDDNFSVVDKEYFDETSISHDIHRAESMLADHDDITVQSTTSSLESDNSHPCYHFHEYGEHTFDQVTLSETASFKIMSLLDNSGAPRICYDRLVALLKKLSKEGFNVQKALNRDTLMRRIGRQHKTLPRIQPSVIHQQAVFRFKFQEMLQDLVHSCNKHLHWIQPYQPQDTVEIGTEHELWNTRWMRNTFALPQFSDFDQRTHIMLPIILYMDKTGTDVNQRYSLEPVLFSLAAISREQRESRHSWRHLGFLPQKHSNSEDESTSFLQFYHDCLFYLLDGLREAQQNPPLLSLKLSNGQIVQRKAFLPLMVVMGDQLSQDTLCGRLKSNSGGAGRVHRSCMCSYLNIDDPYHNCKKINFDTLQFLITHARVTDEDIDLMVLANSSNLVPNTKEVRSIKTFFQKQRSMFRSILRHPFTTHPIKNAFDGIDFGSWTAGIYEATFDDFMHSVEGGMVSYITESVYDGLTKKEKETVEDLTRPILDDQRCSVASDYPRWRLQPGFTRQTMMTSGERVGSVLALGLSLHDPKIRETIRAAHSRQIQKYLDLSSEPPYSKPEFYLNQHMHTLEDDCIRHTMEHMVRHGFNIALIDDLDPFQINQMIWQCADIFKTTVYPDNYPARSIEGSYNDLGIHFTISKKQLEVVRYAFQTQPSKLLEKHRTRKVEGTVGKHLQKKINRKGEGSTAAVLTNNMGMLVVFLEYVLCYHAFCKYSWTLPVFLQRNLENISAGNRFVVEYFEKLIYRGNTTVDSRFPKIHAQCRMGVNTAELNTIMNCCCETGERLLKTEAKGISRTAQQRGNETFLTQTMSRIRDRLVLDSFSMYLNEQEKLKETPDQISTDQFGRTYPNFVYDVDMEQHFAVNRNNEASPPNEKSGYLASEIIGALQQHEPDMKRFKIYNEVILRDNSRLRASPNYANAGPWYDYANVSWEKSINNVIEEYLLPAKCLCFFSKPCEETGDQEIMALIHTADQSSQGSFQGRTDTLLTRNYRMQFDKHGKPVTHVVPVASIDSAIRCYPHVPCNGLFNSESPGITHLLPRNHWSYVWMAVNDVLQESNSKDKVRRRKGRLISLSSGQWLEEVRVRYQTYLNAKCHDDL